MMSYNNYDGVITTQDTVTQNIATARDVEGLKGGNQHYFPTRNHIPDFLWLSVQAELVFHCALLGFPVRDVLYGMNDPST